MSRFLSTFVVLVSSIPSSVAVADTGFPSDVERPTECGPRDDEPLPIERLTAPAGSFWWINNDGFDENDLGNVTPINPEGAPIYFGDEPEIVTYSESFGVPVPVDATPGATFSALGKILTVGDDLLDARAPTVVNVSVVDRRVRNCSCDDGSTETRLAIEIDGGPAVIETLIDDGATNGMTGFLVAASDGPRTVIVPVFPRSTESGSTVVIHLRAPRTHEVSDSQTFDFPDDLLLTEDDPPLRACTRNGCGCNASNGVTGIIPVVALSVCIALALHRRRPSAKRGVAWR